jgi:hypothetical protein
MLQIMTPASPTSVQRRPPGQIRDAIVSALRKTGRPMKVGDIRAAVALQLGGDISSSSIRSYLNLNCKVGQQFRRTGRGVYELR